MFAAIRNRVAQRVVRAVPRRNYGGSEEYVGHTGDGLGGAQVQLNP